MDKNNKPNSNSNNNNSNRRSKSNSKKIINISNRENTIE